MGCCLRGPVSRDSLALVVRLSQPRSQHWNVNMYKIPSTLPCGQSTALSSTSIIPILIASILHPYNQLYPSSVFYIMITATFVGLGLTTLPHLLRLFGRPLRLDVPLASTFPAWVDAEYGPVIFPDEVSRVKLFFYER